MDNSTVVARSSSSLRLLLYLLLPLLCLHTQAQEEIGTPGGKIRFKILDSDDEGFKHPDLGAKRREGLVEAGRIWEEALIISVPITIAVFFESISDDIVAAALTSQFYTETGGRVQTLTVGYSAALASQLAGFDCRPATENEVIDVDIEYQIKLKGTHGYIKVNSNVDEPLLHPDGLGMFYYGDDPDEIMQLAGKDFVSTMLHEIGHLLGFTSRLSKWDGSFSGGPMMTPGIPLFLSQFDANLYDPEQYGTILHAPSSIWNGYRRAVLVEDRLCWGHGYAHGVASKLLGVNSPVLLSARGDHEFPYIRLANGLKKTKESDHQVGHLFESFAGLLMEPFGQLFFLERGLDIAVPMLHDMRWPINSAPDVFVEPPNLTFSGVEYGAGLGWIVTISNLGLQPLTGSVSIDQGEVVTWYSFPDGFDPHFELEQYWERKYVTIWSRPTANSYHIHSTTARLLITTNDPDEDESTVIVPLSTTVPLDDSDGDGNCDHNEPGGNKIANNPFDLNDPDSTGDNGLVVSDGVLDGLNDFDGDGVMNVAEFDAGTSPFDANVYPILEDSDGDGVADYDEIRDLDYSAEGIQNPFDPWRADPDGDGILDGDEDYDGDGIPNCTELAYPTIFDVLLEDVTGDNGSIGTDSVPDGQNDFDGDGISNEDEIRYGLDILVYTAIGDIDWQLCVAGM